MNISPANRGYWEVATYHYLKMHRSKKKKKKRERKKKKKKRRRKVRAINDTRQLDQHVIPGGKFTVKDFQFLINCPLFPITLAAEPGTVRLRCVC